MTLHRDSPLPVNFASISGNQVLTKLKWFTFRLPYTDEELSNGDLILLKT